MSDTPGPGGLQRRPSRASKTSIIPAVKRDDCWNRIGVRGDGSCEELKLHVHCRNCPVFTSSGRSLLDRFMAADYRAELTTLLAREKETIAKGSVALFGFRIHTEWLALPTSVFIEMTEPKTIRRVPYRSNPNFKGMVNIRGELQLCVSLHRLLGLDEPANTPTRRLAVVEKDRQRWVFPVDEVLGLIRCETKDLEKPPVTVAKAASPHVKSVLKWQEREVGVLDDELVCYQLGRSVQ
ncbi:MAG TPA: chemotaxis protein CheW [Planctomycetota bacterium]|nr:chemotaxis protein CheW [Planctomycetota bacterium]